MQTGVDKLKAKLDNAEQALGQTPATSTTTPATNNDLNGEQLQQDFDKAKLRYEKALTALEKAQADENPAAQRMQISVNKLKAKADEAQIALRSALSQLPMNSKEEQE